MITEREREREWTYYKFQSSILVYRSSRIERYVSARPPALLLILSPLIPFSPWRVSKRIPLRRSANTKNRLKEGQGERERLLFKRKASSFDSLSNYCTQELVNFGNWNGEIEIRFQSEHRSARVGYFTFLDQRHTGQRNKPVYSNNNYLRGTERTLTFESSSAMHFAYFPGVCE